MIIERFLRKFAMDSGELVEDESGFYKNLPDDLFRLLELHGGGSYSNGLYRIHTFKTGVRWSQIIGEYFPKYQRSVYPFGFDWMGRQFCLDATKSNMIYMLDPATGEDFELEQNLFSLHNIDFVDDADSMLADNLFKEILSLNNVDRLDFKECLGYEIPLFFGGKDSADNYEVIDMEVYWQISSQLFRRVLTYPEGTHIRDIKIIS